MVTVIAILAVALGLSIFSSVSPSSNKVVNIQAKPVIQNSTRIVQAFLNQSILGSDYRVGPIQILDISRNISAQQRQELIRKGILAVYSSQSARTTNASNGPLIISQSILVFNSTSQASVYARNSTSQVNNTISTHEFKLPDANSSIIRIVSDPQHNLRITEARFIKGNLLVELVLIGLIDYSSSAMQYAQAIDYGLG